MDLGSHRRSSGLEWWSVIWDEDGRARETNRSEYSINRGCRSYAQERAPHGYPMHQDVVFDDGPRVEFLSENLRSLLTAVRNGSNTRVYFVWSLMDLYELLSVRDTYGLYYVDFADKDMKRYPRSSAIWPVSTQARIICHA
ncbi:beta-glucosidase 10 [Brachypodium distachyon]|uniref:beta-glucosidase 10 n=1 Tax=Brachypodium distachyon TaxID=15368 RepID=UPI0001C71EFA|nr:beta-glucosidase 10 [Brachypodium distachyon]|eukprot:XP_024314915.1 beta-glucosidase 10 [Brachypodium distachyon]